MAVVTHPVPTSTPAVGVSRRDDRPSWIPPDVGDDWDPDPYAYLTEEERMPASHSHNVFLQLIFSMLSIVLSRKGCRFSADILLLYRNVNGQKKRFCPDGLIAPHHLDWQDPRIEPSYDLDSEPVPSCVIEVTSPDSRDADFYDKRFLNEWLGIPEYLVFDLVTPSGKLRNQGQVSLWRMNPTGRYQLVHPDDEGFVWIQCVNMRVKMVGLKPILQDMDTGQFLAFPAEVWEKWEHEAKARETAEAQAQREAEARKVAEEARKAAEEELRQLKAKFGLLDEDDG